MLENINLSLKEWEWEFIKKGENGNFEACLQYTTPIRHYIDIIYEGRNEYPYRAGSEQAYIVRVGQ